MDRRMYQNGVGPLQSEALHSFLATMSRTVVHDPEHTPSRLVGFLCHDVSDKLVSRPNAVLDFAATKEPPLVHIPRRQVRPGPVSLVFVLNSHRETGRWRQRKVFALPCLNAGFFVCGNDEFSQSQFSALPNPTIEIQNPPGLFGELRVARENPTAVTPWSQCIGTQPAPQGCATHIGNDDLGNHFSPNVSDRESRQRQTQTVWKFTRQGLYLDYDAGGKSGPIARRGAVPQGLAASPGRIAFATCLRFVEEYRGVMQ